MASGNDRQVVQVVFARPEEQPIVEVEFEAGMTAGAAVERSGFVGGLEDLSKLGLIVGVWGVEVSNEHELKAGDRVELSRPLQADPRDMRRELMTDGRVMGGAPAPKAFTKKRAGK